MKIGNFYLLSYHQYHNFASSHDLIRYIGRRKNKGFFCQIMASDLNEFVLNEANAYNNYFLGDDTFFDSIQSIEEVPKEKLPLYIGWPFINPILSEILKAL